MTFSKRRPQIIVAQLGARMHYAVPMLLHRAGMLAHFYTDTFVGPGSLWHLPLHGARLIPKVWRPAPLARLLGRREDSLPPHKVTAFNFFGMRYALALSQAADRAAREAIYLDWGQRFCSMVNVDNFPTAAGIYAFEGAARPLFEQAEQCGMFKIMEKFIAPLMTQYELLSEEHRLWPCWESPYPDIKLWEKRIAYEKQEWCAADAVICPSHFVAQGLASHGIRPDKVFTVSYGVEVSRFSVLRTPWDGCRPMRVLFVGGVSLRKGVQYLYQALKLLSGFSITARMVGPIAIQDPYRRLLSDQAELIGHVPRDEVIRHYAWADLLVFPSICEGSATVTYEALAAGLPVITTPNTGSVVRDGIDGFILPIRDRETLAEKIELLARDPELLNWMSQNARQRAQDFSWQRYGDRLLTGIKLICEKANTL